MPNIDPDDIDRFSLLEFDTPLRDDDGNRVMDPAEVAAREGIELDMDPLPEAPVTRDQPAKEMLVAAPQMQEDIAPESEAEFLQLQQALARVLDARHIFMRARALARVTIRQPDRPLAAAYLAAAAFRDGEQATAEDADAAEAAVDVARQAWLDSDEIREWEYRGESLDGGRDRGFWHAPSEAEAELRAWAESGTYEQVDRIFIVSDWARQIDPVTDEAICDGQVSSSVTIQPEEPDCTEPDHDWQSPVELVGHGPRANGGGVIYEEVCAHCGVYRVTDTWAQDCLTGQQGLREVSYRPADETSSAWIQAARDAAMIEACPWSLDRDHRKAPGRYVIEIDDVDVDDDVACAAVREEIKEAIGAGWSVEWTGDGSDLSIEWVGP